MLHWTFLVMISPPVRAVVVATAELMRAQVVKVVTLGILDQTVVTILNMTLLSCRGVFVVPLGARDHISAALLLAAATRVGTIIVAKHIFQ
jgi:hypothetical protein